MKNILVVGTGGLAREFASYFSGDLFDFNIVGFFGINKNVTSKPTTKVNPGDLFTC